MGQGVAMIRRISPADTELFDEAVRRTADPATRPNGQALSQAATLERGVVARRATGVDSWTFEPFSYSDE
jgi:hypothetical protein